jgi:hypothetical protein
VFAVNWGSVPDYIAALAAIVAGLVGWRYLEWTRRMWEETSKQRESALMLSLMEDYDGMRESIDFVRSWSFESLEAGLDPTVRFDREVGFDFYDNDQARLMDEHRHRVSRFFVKTRKLVFAGYLTEKIVRDALGGQAIEDVFLKLIDPLDKVKAPGNYQSIDRAFYTHLLLKYPRRATGLADRCDVPVA